VAALLLHRQPVAPSGFDGLYGQDPYAYYDQAVEVREALRGGPEPGPFFWPMGYPALLAGGFTLFGVGESAAQTINLVLLALLSPLVYAIARLVDVNRPGALLSGLLMLACGQAWQSGVVIMADIPALFWLTASALALFAYLKTDRSGLLAASAVLLALAGITRWLSLIAAIPWIAAVLIHWRGRIRWRAGLLAVAAGLPILLAQLAYSVVSPYPTIDHPWVTGWNPANALRSAFTGPDGRLVYATTNTEFYAAIFHEPFYMAALFIPLVLAGLVWLARRNRPAAIALAGWALLPYFFLIGIPYQNIRFPLPASPALFVLAGIGFSAIWIWITQRQRLKHTYARVAIAALCLAAAFGLWRMVDAGESYVHTFIANQQRDKDVVTAAADRIPAGATLYTFGLTLTFEHYTDFTVHELYYETPQTLVERVPGEADYLLLNVWQIENQWAGREPQIAYHWLRDERGLRQIARFGNYTLFEVSE
jgi:4-amino-4-deoxy-L-arabinose transferase-like glycosyltransferase